MKILKSITRLFLGFCLLISSVNYLHAQEINAVLSEGEQEVFEQAKEQLAHAEYKKAENNFSQLLSLYSEEAYFNYAYGVCLVQQNKNVDKAIDYLKKANSSGNITDCLYYLGKAYHLRYKFDRAISYYEAYRKKTEDVELPVKRQTRMAVNGKSLVQYAYLLDIMENTRLRIDDFHYSYKLDNIGGRILSKHPDYMSKYDEKHEGISLMFLSEKHDMLFFSSHGKKNKTGKDIYLVKKDKEGKWGEPEKLPFPVNTNEDDAFPYLHPDGEQFFFCSKGHNSMGGYDIFKCNFNMFIEEFSIPQNMDFPINSPLDDILYVKDSTNRFAYYASSRSTENQRISIYKIRIKEDKEKRKLESIEDIRNTAQLEVNLLSDNMEKRKDALQLEESNTGNREELKMMEPADFTSNKVKDMTWPKLSSSYRGLYERIEQKEYYLQAQNQKVLHEMRNALADNDPAKLYNAHEVYKYNTNLLGKIEADQKVIDDWEKDIQKLRETDNKAATTEFRDLLVKTAQVVMNIEDAGYKSHINSEIEACQIQIDSIQEVLKGIENELNRIHSKEMDIREKQETKITELHHVSVQNNTLKKEQNSVLAKLKDKLYEKRRIQNQLDRAISSLRHFNQTNSKAPPDAELKYSSIDGPALRNVLQEHNKNSLAEIHAANDSIFNIRLGNWQIAAMPPPGEIQIQASRLYALEMHEFPAGIVSDTTQKAYHTINNQISGFNAGLKKIQAQFTDSLLTRSNIPGSLIQKLDSLENVHSEISRSVSDNIGRLDIAKGETSATDSLNRLIAFYDARESTAISSSLKEIRSEISGSESGDILAVSDKKNTNEGNESISENEDREEPEAVAGEDGSQENATQTGNTTETKGDEKEGTFDIAAHKNDSIPPDAVTDSQELATNLQIENNKDTDTTKSNSQIQRQDTIESHVFADSQTVSDTSASDNNIQNKKVADTNTGTEDSSETIDPEIKDENTETPDFLADSSTASDSVDIDSKAQNNDLSDSTSREKDENRENSEGDEYISPDSPETDQTADTSLLPKFAADGIHLYIKDKLAKTETEKDQCENSMREAVDILKEVTVKLNQAESNSDGNKKTLINLSKDVENAYHRIKKMLYTRLAQEDSLYSALQKRAAGLGSSFSDIIDKAEMKDFLAARALNNDALNTDTSSIKALEERVQKMHDANSKMLAWLHSLAVGSGEIPEKSENINLAHTTDSLVEEFRQQLQKHGKREILAELSNTEAETLTEEQVATQFSTKFNALNDLQEDYVEKLVSYHNSDEDTAKQNLEDNIISLDFSMFSQLKGIGERLAMHMNDQIEEQANMLEYFMHESFSAESIKYSGRKKYDALKKEFDSLKNYEKQHPERYFQELQQYLITANTINARQQNELKKLSGNAATEIDSLYSEFMVRSPGISIDNAPGALLRNQIPSPEQEVAVYRDSSKTDENKLRKNNRRIRRYSKRENRFENKLEKWIQSDSKRAPRKVRKFEIKEIKNEVALESEKLEKMQLIADNYHHQLSTDPEYRYLSPETGRSFDRLNKIADSLRTKAMYFRNKIEIQPDMHEADKLHFLSLSRQLLHKALKVSFIADELAEGSLETRDVNQFIAGMETKKWMPAQPAEVQQLADRNPDDGSANPQKRNEAAAADIHYKIQVGAFSKTVDNSIFRGIRPISEEFLKGRGLYRYMAGYFNLLSSAENSLDQIQDMGFQDAFIVAYVNGERMTPGEAANYAYTAMNEESRLQIQADNTKEKEIREEVSDEKSDDRETPKITSEDLFYTVQIGVFSRKTDISSQIDMNIDEYYLEAKGLFKYYTGRFVKYQNAAQHRDKVIAAGIPDAFVTALRGDTRIKLEEAAGLLNDSLPSTSEETAEPPSAPETDRKVEAADVEFRIQIGVFSATPGIEYINSLRKLSSNYSLEVRQRDNFEIYEIQGFSTYQEAREFLSDNISNKIPDAFITAFSEGKKISIQEARLLLKNY